MAQKKMHKKHKKEKSYPKGKPAKAKMSKVLEEYKEGELKSGSKKGPKVTSKAQAIAIGLSEGRKAKKRCGKKKK